MKKILLLFLLLFTVLVAPGLYFLDKDYFLCPIAYKTDIVIRSDSRGSGMFASSRSGNRVHKGIDLLAGTGTPVAAARSGIVVWADEAKGMGKYVAIRHMHHLTTIYGHLSQICVRKNEFVRQGCVIGQVGKTGNANHPGMLPHLHFEVRKNNSPEDPLVYLR